jgi:hypothetical protein
MTMGSEPWKRLIDGSGRTRAEGGKARFVVDGKEVGYATDIAGSEEIEYEPVERLEVPTGSKNLIFNVYRTDQGFECAQVAEHRFDGGGGAVMLEKDSSQLFYVRVSRHWMTAAEVEETWKALFPQPWYRRLWRWLKRLFGR